MKRVLGHLRRADEDFGMIQHGEKIAVGVSGGKDSITLLYALHLYKNFCKAEHSVHAFTVDLGFEGFDTIEIGEFCAQLGIAYTCVKTNISKIVFDTRKEKNPCSLCSKLRKGALFNEIKKHGISKCAFGHHRDDAIETLMMSLLYEGRIRTFKPVTYLNRKDITLIRPFVYLAEKEIVTAAKKFGFPLSSNPCPASGNTKRQQTKELLTHMSASNPKLYDSMLTALKNTSQYSLWD